MPADLTVVLKRAGVVVTDGSSEEGLSEEATMKAFSKLYKPETYDGPINVYAGNMESSGGESSLEPGRAVRLVHIANVEQEVTPPDRGQGDSKQSSRIVNTDMVAFFDAKTGEHLATMYIGDGPIGAG